MARRIVDYRLNTVFTAQTTSSPEVGDFIYRSFTPNV